MCGGGRRLSLLRVRPRICHPAGPLRASLQLDQRCLGLGLFGDQRGDYSFPLRQPRLGRSKVSLQGPLGCAGSRQRIALLRQVSRQLGSNVLFRIQLSLQGPHLLHTPWAVASGGPRPMGRPNTSRQAQAAGAMLDC